MDVQGLIIFLAIGAIAGWLAGTWMKGGGFGLLGNIIVGIIGAVVGGFVFGLLGISAAGLIGSVISATAGAGLLLCVVGRIKKSESPRNLSGFAPRDANHYKAAGYKQPGGRGNRHGSGGNQCHPGAG